MLLEAEFWVAVAFVIFMGIAWKVGGFSAMTKGLDGRANRVRHELDEAKRLREEAAAVLADYKRRRAEAEKAKRAAEEGHRKLDDFLARRTKAAETKIAQAEAQAEAQVRAAAAEAAVKVSETILRERMQGEAAQGLIRASLGEVRTRMRS
jgi:F-type H+-transporting ATPase subunit b